MGNTKKWTMRDGKKIRIRDMTDKHIRNAIVMLERGAMAKKASDDKSACMMEATFADGGDMATLSSEQAALQQYEKGWNEYLPDIYWDLDEELDRRRNRN